MHEKIKQNEKDKFVYTYRKNVSVYDPEKTQSHTAD